MIHGLVFRRYLSCKIAVLAVFFAVQSLLSGCRIAPPLSPETALEKVRTPALEDDLDLDSLFAAIKQQQALYDGSKGTIQFGPRIIKKQEYFELIDALIQLHESGAGRKEIFQFISENFDFMQVAGAEETPGQVLLTSYFEPIVEASTHRTEKFSCPLYRKPSDLLSIPLREYSPRFQGENSLRGRLVGTLVKPYFSRDDIDGKGALRNRNLEMAWVDPVDAFFLQIQGSGTLKFPKHEVHAVYADKNGLAYVPIGKFIKDQMEDRKVTMPRLERHLRRLSRYDQQKLMNRNPSYVFFSESKKRAITSSGIPATPGRTIATDPKLLPKGALAYLVFDKPVFSSPEETEPSSHRQSSRFVVDQDSGGAITGTGRVDLFWGRGDEAKQYAGVIQGKAKLYYLAPKLAP